MSRLVLILVSLAAFACAPAEQGARVPATSAPESAAHRQDDARELTWPALAELPWPAPQTAFTGYGSRVRDELWALYVDGGVELYCRIEFTADEAAARRIDSGILTWEHVYPADRIAEALGFEDRGCKTPEADAVAREDTCLAAISDMHNLWPASGRINSSRSNHPYGLLEGEGTNNPTFAEFCPDFERTYGTRQAFIEPTDTARGDIARSLIYMHFVYDLPLEPVIDEPDRLLEWAESDPVDRDELDREVLIRERQGTGSPLIVLPTPSS
ncbi:MAG: endonuclease [Tistlia sp.]|uniref:endonuclease n=1 Tax=Tistlia sp. TaxID=3057121 RepID=UPI0034A506ED